jgi:hypothetical protein
MAFLRHPRVLLAAAIAVVALAGATALALASAGAGADDDVFTIALRDGTIELDDSTLSPGRGVIEVANAGSEEHELVLVHTRRPAGEIPVGLHGVSPSLAGEVVIGEDHAAAGHRHPAGRVLGLLPGQSRRHQVELGPGTYVVLCQTDNHYLEGERATLVVR